MLLLIENFNNQEEETRNSPIEVIYLYMNGYNPDYLYRWTILDNIYIAILYIITFFNFSRSSIFIFFLQMGRYGK